MSRTTRRPTRIALLAVLSILALHRPAWAQNTEVLPVESTYIALSLLVMLLVLTILMALILGDRIIALARVQFFGDGDAYSSEFRLAPTFTGGEKKQPVHSLSKGFEIKLRGAATRRYHTDFSSATYAVRPTDYRGLQPIPKMLVSEGDEVRAGDPLFHDRKRDDFMFTAPVSGEVVEIRRGAKRAITEVVILADQTTSFKELGTLDPTTASREDLVEHMKASGVWGNFVQRPFGNVADTDVVPRDIFVSTFDTAPLAADMRFVFDDVDPADWQAGIDALSALTEGSVHLGVDASRDMHPLLAATTGAETHLFKGKHPAGNVGVQIHHVAPIAKGDIVWTLRPEDVVTLGKTLVQGIYDPIQYVAVAGAPLRDTFYIKTRKGASIKAAIDGNLTDDNVRIVSGNVLTGSAIDPDGHLTGFANCLTVLEEGDFHEAFGWLVPSYARPSLSPTFPWSLIPFADFEANTNTHGERRAFVVTGQYEAVTPMDIYPQHLLKAIISNDFEKIEGLGIYEVLEEDLALCEFVCTSKQPVQAILREGLDYIESQS